MYYNIEEIVNERKRNKKMFFIIIIAIIIIILAIMAGINFAKHVKNNEKTAQNTNENETQEIEKEETGFNKDQIKAINKIYNSDTKRAFLTFDDGPSYQVTTEILDILKEENIKATFFVLGTMVKSNPEVLRREHEEGHYIANHGYSHVYSKVYKNKNSVLEEYKKCEKEIKKALNDENYSSNLFRFPGGSVGGPYDDVKKQAIKEFEKQNIAYLDWNALTFDADGAETKEEIMNNLKDTVEGKDSVVILMHDAPNKDLTAETLKSVIKYLKDEGYSFKNIYDII